MEFSRDHFDVAAIERLLKAALDANEREVCKVIETCIERDEEQPYLGETFRSRSRLPRYKLRLTIEFEPSRLTRDPQPFIVPALPQGPIDAEFIDDEE